MKAFVTGATGFIGSNLVNKLLEDGWFVKILVRGQLKRKFNNYKNLQIFKGDITDAKAIDLASKDIDVVFNLAAGLPYHNLTREEYWQTNVAGTKNILAMCRKNKIRKLVHVSTVGIYGPYVGEVIDEKSPIRAKDDYSKSKAAAEEIIDDYVKSYNLPLVIIRPTIGYGPGDTRPGFLNLFRLIKKGIFIPVGEGNNFFHTIYIDNLIDALVLAATNKQAIGEDFIIGDNICPEMRDIIKAIYKVENQKMPKFNLSVPLAIVVARIFDFFQFFGLKVPLTSKRLQFITENRKYDIKKAKKVLGYQPKIDLEEGIRRTYRWYIKNGYL